MSLSRDFIEFIECLTRRRVEYLLVGGYALAFHGLPRFTKDIDFWINPTPDNAARVLEALHDFGFGELDIEESDFRNPGKVIQLGLPPNRIDLVTSIDGVCFEDAFGRKVNGTYSGLPLQVICKTDLIANKNATGREQDLLDAKNLSNID